MDLVPLVKSTLLMEKVEQRFSKLSNNFLLLSYRVFFFFIHSLLNPSLKPVKSPCNFSDSCLHFMVTILFLLDLFLTDLKIGLYCIFASCHSLFINHSGPILFWAVAILCAVTGMFMTTLLALVQGKHFPSSEISTLPWTLSVFYQGENTS